MDEPITLPLVSGAPAAFTASAGRYHMVAAGIEPGGCQLYFSRLGSGDRRVAVQPPVGFSADGELYVRFDEDGEFVIVGHKLPAGAAVTISPVDG